MMTVKVRFAPSPTGFLHVGNVRIAIINFLYSLKNSGIFVLRIDDTDLERSTKESEDLIIEDLKWLGIQWQEFYRQSENISQYTAAFERLKSIGRVYKCYESKEELDIKRKLQSSKGVPPVYDRASLNLSDQQAAEYEAQGRKPYWRFKLNNETVVSWRDLVHGEIKIALNTVSDPVIVRPDGGYVYTFASVVDDVNIGISHIIRGDDHITNTATQIDIFNALCGKSPQFAHVPLLSSIDGSDVSKRSGSNLSIVNLRKNGIDPMAIISILSNIGTSSSPHHDDIISDLSEKINLEKMSLASPKFNISDVENLSKKMLSNKSFEQVKQELMSLGLRNADYAFWDVVKENIHSLPDTVFWYNVLFNNDVPPVKLDKQFVHQMHESAQTHSSFEEWLSDVKKKSGKSGKDLYHPIRLVLTGADKGPELGKIASIIGYEELKNRIKNSLEIS